MLIKLYLDNEESGTANLVLSNINGHSLSKGNFIIVIKPSNQAQPESKFSIPSWIKNNAGWWAENTIDDDSFIQGIQFLIKEGIIEIQN